MGSLNLAPEQGSTMNVAIEVDSAEPRRERPSGGVLGVGGPFGVILDYSSDIPRFRGLAFSPNQHVRVEARGEVDADLSEMGARVSVHFSF